MAGFSNSLSLGLGSRRISGGTPTPSYTGALTLTALNSYESKRIYQRATTSGGGQGKGQGPITLTISSATAGTIGVRIVDQASPTTVLQTCATKTLAGGETSLTISDVDARYGWFFVELCGSNGIWQRTSEYMGMGALFGFAGQSLMARMFGRQDAQTATYNSIYGTTTLNNNTSVLATYNEGNPYPNPYVLGATTLPWQTPGDVGNSNGPNAIGIGEFLDKMAGLLGINCGGFGHSQGGTSIATYYSGQSNWTQLNNVITRIGGSFEGFVWGQGHTESNYGCPPVAYGDALSVIFSQVTAANSYSGYSKIVWTIPAIGSSSWGTPFEYNWVRQGAKAWCDANSAVYAHMYDFAQVDAIHESQAGSRTMGQHIYRAFRTTYGASSGLGPAVVSATRTAAQTIRVTLSDVGQTNLVLVGSPQNRIWVQSTGKYNRNSTPNDNRFPISSVTVINKTTLDLALANDPGDQHVLDLWVYWPCGPADATVDNIYDDRTDGDGITNGRIVQANFSRVGVAAYNPAGSAANNPPTTAANVSPFTMVETSTTYGASAGGGSFGNEMTGGTAISANNKTPAFYPVTIEGFFTCPTISGTQVFFGGYGVTAANYVGVNSSGKIVSGLVTGATTLVAGRRYHVAIQAGPSGKMCFLADITSATAGVRDAFTAGAVTIPVQSCRFAMRNLGGSFTMSGGATDEWAVFNSERYADVTAYNANRPTAPFTGAEANIVALFHCDSDAKDSIAA